MKMIDRRGDARRKVSFIDACEDNSCIIWIVAVFKDKLPKYIDKNCPKKWRKDLSDLYDWIDPDEVNQIINEVGEKAITYTIIAEYKYDWTEDPKKDIQDQIYGQNIAGWLHKNDQHKSLVYAYSWNKID